MEWGSSALTAAVGTDVYQTLMLLCHADVLTSDICGSYQACDLHAQQAAC